MLELLGQKIGMSHLFDENGSMIPLTMIKLYENCVLELDEESGKALVAFEKAADVKKLSKPAAGVFAKKSLPAFKKIKGSSLPKSLTLEVGKAIELENVLVEGDIVNVSGTSIGKGFAGAMKRWNFGGLEATHGISISHRSHGSTGQCQDPGKVFKGKKMAGHLGVEKVTIKNLEVLLVDKENSVVAVKGAVPGHAGNDVILKVEK